MPLSLKQYGVNLYSMNGLGEQWMDQTVTASTFRGPPIVLVNSVINDPLRPDVIAVADFADYWNAPLIGFDTTVVASSWATAILRNACLAATKFFTMPRIGPFPPLTTATLTASLASPARGSPSRHSVMGPASTHGIPLRILALHGLIRIILTGVACRACHSM